MPSSFGWLDTDQAQRRRMLEVVDLFKEQGTVDELGVGSIRDTFSDALFPGTSTLLTRLRYVLFVPWLVQRAVRDTPSIDEAVRRLRADEVRLIESLLEGYRDEERGRNQGILGQTARAKLKRMPSEVYWGPLGRWQLRTWDTSVVGHLRLGSALRGAGRGRTETDDPGARDSVLDTGFDLAGLEPPVDLLRSTTFDLRPEEAEVLLERLRTTTHGSLLGWLLEHRESVDLDAASAAELSLVGAPSDLQTVLDHATRFSLAMQVPRSCTTSSSPRRLPSRTSSTTTASASTTGTRSSSRRAPSIAGIAASCGASSPHATRRSLWQPACSPTGGSTSCSTATASRTRREHATLSSSESVVSRRDAHVSSTGRHVRRGRASRGPVGSTTGGA